MIIITGILWCHTANCTSL